MFAYATLRQVTTVENFESRPEDSIYEEAITVHASITHLSTVRRDWSALSERHFINYFHHLQENSKYFVSEIEQTIMYAKNMIKNNDVKYMSVIFKNTEEFKELAIQECNHLPLSMVPLQDGWIHPLSEFDTLTHEPSNNWGKASYVMGVLCNRMPIFKFESLDMRENQRAYLLKYMISLRLHSLQSTPISNLDHFFSGVVRYLDTLYLELLHKLAQTLGKK